MRWLAAAVAVGLVASVSAVALALSTDTAQIQNSDFTTDTLDAPTSLAATGGLTISLTWTATSDTYAAGHRVYRATSSGGSYSQIAQLTPRTTVTHIDNPGIGTWFYVTKAYVQNWESASSNEVSCTRTILTYSC